MLSNFIQVAKREKKEITKLMVVFSLALFVLFVGWDKIVKTEVYNSFNSVYNVFAVKIVQSLGSVSEKDIAYDTALNILTCEENSTKLIMPVDSYRYFVIGFVLLALIPLKYWKSTLSVIVFVLLFLAIRAGFVTFMFLFYKNTIHNIILLWIDPIIFIAMLILCLYIINHNSVLKKLFDSLAKRFSDILTVSLSTLLFLLIIVPPLPRVLLTYLHDDIMPGIATFILNISKILLKLINESAYIFGKIIYLDNNWVDLQYPCIGLGVFSLIAVLIFVMKGNLKLKIIYLLFFAVFYLILNALRLSVLLIYINKTYHEIGLNKLELHNNATYFMYLVAFGGFLGYWLILNSNNYNNVCK